MSVIVTGGAGFIGSCVVKTLNDEGVDDVIIVDNISSTDKWLNLRNKKYSDYIHKNSFLDRLVSLGDGVTHVIHMGACSSTTEKDFDYLWNNNFEYSKILWNYCKERRINFIYASSAATYGDGKNGFDDKKDIGILQPLNGYGYSKQVFDIWRADKDETSFQCVGLKFFNVYGPNEYFKGNMASMVYHGYKQIKKDGEIRLFKSDNPNYGDGEQLRDFVYVKDVCEVIKWFYKNPDISGLFNVATGRAQSFKELAEAVFHAIGIKPNIRYIDMPDNIKMKYQYYTRGKIDKLRDVGCNVKFLDVEAGVRDYVQNYLDKNFRIY